MIKTKSRSKSPGLFDLILLAQFVKQFTLVFIKAVPADSAKADCFRVAQCAAKCFVVLLNGLFCRQALFGGQALALNCSDLLSLSPGRFNALFRALMVVRQFLFGLLKGCP